MVAFPSRLGAIVNTNDTARALAVAEKISVTQARRVLQGLTTVSAIQAKMVTRSRRIARRRPWRHTMLIDGEPAGCEYPDD